MAWRGVAPQPRAESEMLPWLRDDKEPNLEEAHDG